MQSRFYLFLFIIGSFIMRCANDSFTTGQVSPEWELIWQDEFNGDGTPNPDNWRFSGRKSPDWACYCADNSSTTFVKNGQLYLRGIINKDENDTAKYQTGCIQTKDKFSFKYGKIEVKAKLSRGKGSWPAIWMMPQDSKYGGWPYSGEIDIMEHLNFDTIVYQTLHTHYIDVMNQKDNPVYYTVHPHKPKEYNIFGLEWFPDRLDFYLNGEKTFSYPKIDNADHKQWPFDQEFYIILDQALGGNWVGSINDKDLPVEMVVDWVRVYQSKD
jgi:beta-glucanase (GH16 family)